MSHSTRAPSRADREPPVVWHAAVPLKPLARAKSRLLPLGDGPRRALAEAMAADTVTACLAALGRGRVHVVTADEQLADRMASLGAMVVADPGGGLDDAVRAGAAAVRSVVPDAGVVAVVGDLPCLAPDDLRRTLTAAAGHPRTFVPDAAGTGTVLLTAAPGVDVEPRFGLGSARRHASVAVRLDAPDALRLDVDDEQAWMRARTIGPGPHSRALVSGGSAS